MGPLAVLLAGFVGSGAAALPNGVRWDWQLQAPLDLSVAVDVLALDPDEVSAADIATLKARGVFTVCYISVGTWEDWRLDAPDFPASSLGRAYDGWPGERFLDITDPNITAIMVARIERCAAMGFDAIEPDNIDLHINDTGFSIGPREVTDYFSMLSTVAHQNGLEIAQKNAPDLTEALHPFADFAMTENCFVDGWCAQMAPYVQSGRAVLSAEYTRASMPVCQSLGRNGYSLVFKTYDLTRDGENCGF